MGLEGRALCPSPAMNIDEVAQKAEKSMRDLQGMVQGSNCKLKGSKVEDEKVFKALDQAAQRAQVALDSYKLELRGMPKEQQEEHRLRVKNLEDGLRTSRGELTWKKTQARNQAAQSLLDAQAPSGGTDEEGGGISLEQVQQEANKVQDASKQSLDRSMKMVVEAEQVGIATLEKMHAQEEQLDSIGHELEDVRANLKRSKKLLAQIARGAAGDRCIQFLCLGLCAAIMVAMILSAFGFDGGRLNTPDQVKAT